MSVEESGCSPILRTLEMGGFGQASHLAKLAIHSAATLGTLRNQTAGIGGGVGEEGARHLYGSGCILAKSRGIGCRISTVFPRLPELFCTHTTLCSIEHGRGSRVQGTRPCKYAMSLALILSHTVMNCCPEVQRSKQDAEHLEIADCCVNQVKHVRVLEQQCSHQVDDVHELMTAI